MLPAFESSTFEMISKWEKLISSGEGSCEIDVWPDLQNLTRDVISKTAFGSSFKEGSRIFELQEELAKYIVESAQSVYISGWRYNQFIYVGS